MLPLVFGTNFRLPFVNHALISPIVTRPVFWMALLPSVLSTHHSHPPSPLTLSCQAWSEQWKWRWWKLFWNRGVDGYSEAGEYGNSKIWRQMSKAAQRSSRQRYFLWSYTALTRWSWMYKGTDFSASGVAKCEHRSADARQTTTKAGHKMSAQTRGDFCRSPRPNRLVITRLPISSLLELQTAYAWFSMPWRVKILRLLDTTFWAFRGLRGTGLCL